MKHLFILLLLCALLLACKEEIIETCECDAATALCPHNIDDPILNDTSYGIPVNHCFNFVQKGDAQNFGLRESFGTFYANGRPWYPSVNTYLDTTKMLLDIPLDSWSCDLLYIAWPRLNNIEISQDKLGERIYFRYSKVDIREIIDTNSIVGISYLRDSLNFDFDMNIPFELDVAQSAALYDLIDSLPNYYVINKIEYNEEKRNYYYDIDFEVHLYQAWIDDPYKPDSNYVKEIHLTDCNVKGYPYLF